MPKFTIFERVPPTGLVGVVPPDYRALLPVAVRPAESYTVVLFKHDREDVVTSASVRRALAQVGPVPALVAVGGNFTREAIELLEARDASIARLGEFFWTDESYNTLR
jgi:hypothetical protein